MILVDQTIFGDEGNCFSAVLATLLELPLDKVPHFSKDINTVFKNKYPNHIRNKIFFDRVENFLITMKLKLTYVDCSDPKEWNSIPYMSDRGMSDRGGPHAVIYKYGEPFFDPQIDHLL